MMKRILALFAAVAMLAACCADRGAAPRCVLFAGGPDSLGNYFRIPAIAAGDDGLLLTVTDYRYGNHSDLNHHRIDILVKKSEDNGWTWGETKNLTCKFSDDSTGFGDPAVVVDRIHGKSLILCCGGVPGFFGSTREYPQRIFSFVSRDRGETWSDPRDITEQIYGLKESWKGVFFASGKIAQSSSIKTGEYCRIYSVLSVLEEGNYVLYSDDFGENWNILGGVVSPAPSGDEAKVEELPDGTVILSSRTWGGRYLNVFRYSDKDAAQGEWEEPVFCDALYGTACNGELLAVEERDSVLLMQSLPVSEKREKVSIYYRRFAKSQRVELEELLGGWKLKEITPGLSAYSTMCLQSDGRIGFYYEAEPSIYTMVYESLEPAAFE